MQLDRVRYTDSDPRLFQEVGDLLYLTKLKSAVCAIVMTAVSSKEDADKIARALLAACIRVIAID